MKRLLKMEPTPSLQVSAKMTTNNLENCMKLTYKAIDLRSLTPICKKIFKVNHHQTVLYARQKSFIKKHSISIANCIVLFYDILVASSVFSNHHPDESIALSIK